MDGCRPLFANRWCSRLLTVNGCRPQATEDARHAAASRAWREQLLAMEGLLEALWDAQKGYLRVRPFFAARQAGAPPTCPTAPSAVDSASSERIHTPWVIEEVIQGVIP